MNVVPKQNLKLLPSISSKRPSGFSRHYYSRCLLTPPPLTLPEPLLHSGNHLRHFQITASLNFHPLPCKVMPPLPIFQRVCRHMRSWISPSSPKPQSGTPTPVAERSQECSELAFIVLSPISLSLLLQMTQQFFYRETMQQSHCLSFMHSSIPLTNILKTCPMFKAKVDLPR